MSRALGDHRRRRAEGPTVRIVHDHSGFTRRDGGPHRHAGRAHRCTGRSRPGPRAFYATHGRKAAGRAQPGAARAAPPGLGCVGGDPEPHRLGPGPCERQGRLPAVDRAHDAGEGSAPRDRRCPCGRAAARPGGARPARSAGVLRSRGRATPRRDRVRFVGEVGGLRKRSLFAGARALLMPIRWAEPFGMVMVEAMACGTPVVAFPEGSAPRGRPTTGRPVSSSRTSEAMAAAVGELRQHRPAGLPCLGRRALRRRRGRRCLRGTPISVGGRTSAAGTLARCV